jgi:hypothetical protein
VLTRRPSIWALAIRAPLHRSFGSRFHHGGAWNPLLSWPACDRRAGFGHAPDELDAAIGRGPEAESATNGLPDAILGHVASDQRLTDDATVVLAFNDAINRRELTDLAALMTPGHCFVDADGARTQGKDACVDAWRGFFDNFPDYRNIFDDIVDTGSGIVVVRGRSECSFAPLHGPATWRAHVRDGRIAVWQVS